jgi:hypothetical protein
MMVEGHAWVSFPFFTSAAPSLGVLVKSATGQFWVNRDQWNGVAVPLLEAGEITAWRGRIQDFGSAISLSASVYGPNRIEKFAAGTSAGKTSIVYDAISTGLYSDPDTIEFLELVGTLVYNKAVAAGYK